MFYNVAFGGTRSVQWVSLFSTMSTRQTHETEKMNVPSRSCSTANGYFVSDVDGTKGSTSPSIKSREYGINFSSLAEVINRQWLKSGIMETSDVREDAMQLEKSAVNEKTQEMLSEPLPPRAFSHFQY